MSLKEKIREDLIAALKGEKELELSVLRMLLSALTNKETEKKTKIWKEKPDLSPEEIKKEAGLTDEDIFEVVSFEIKKRREAIEGFTRGNRKTLAEKEKTEAEILQKYLPEQLSEEELKKIIAETIKKIGAKEMRDFGKIMSVIMPQVKGKAEGNMISKIVKELLQ